MKLTLADLCRGPRPGVVVWARKVKGRKTPQVFLHWPGLTTRRSERLTIRAPRGLTWPASRARTAVESLEAGDSVRLTYVPQLSQVVELWQVPYPDLDWALGLSRKEARVLQPLRSPRRIGERSCLPLRGDSQPTVYWLRDHALKVEKAAGKALFELDVRLYGDQVLVWTSGGKQKRLIAVADVVREA